MVNTIGNLTLVTKVDNSAAGNRTFEIKKKIFEDTLHIHMNRELYNASDWTSKSIEERSNIIIDELILMYPYLRSINNYEHDENRNIFLDSQGIKAEGYLNEKETVIIYSGSQISSKVEELTGDSY